MNNAIILNNIYDYLFKRNSTDSLMELLLEFCQRNNYDYSEIGDIVSSDEKLKKVIEDTAVNTMKREQEKCDIDDEYCKVLGDFSNKVTVKQSSQIHKIVSEYVNTVVTPRIKKLGYNDDAVDSVYEVLYEFACWMLLK